MVAANLVEQYVAIPCNNLGGFRKERCITHEIVEPQAFVRCTVASPLRPVRVVSFRSWVELTKSVHETSVKHSLKRRSLFRCHTSLLGQVLGTVIPYLPYVNGTAEIEGESVRGWTRRYADDG